SALPRPLPSFPTRRSTHLVGGEAIDPALWSDLARRSEVAFFNVYGPTECTVDTTVAYVQGSNERPLIGRPISNARVYILNRQLRSEEHTSELQSLTNLASP